MGSGEEVTITSVEKQAEMRLFLQILFQMLSFQHQYTCR